MVEYQLPKLRTRVRFPSGAFFAGFSCKNPLNPLKHHVPAGRHAMSCKGALTKQSSKQSFVAMSDHHKIKYGILSVIFSTLLLIGCTYHSASLPSDGSAKAGSSDTAYGNEAASSYVSASAKENVNPVRIQVDNNPRDGSPANTPDLSPSSDDEFYISPISDDLFEKMLGNSYKEGCPVSREDLKYLHILHTDIDGNVLEGELVCHRLIADDLLEIFRELYEIGRAHV